MKWLICLGATGAASLFVLQPVYSEESSAASLVNALTHNNKSSTPKNDRISPNLIEKGATSTAQSIVTIVNVRLKPTQNGLDATLETSSGEALQGKTIKESNNLIIEIANAQLRLSSGETFQQNNPAPGITSVVVAPSGSNTVRVIISGSEGLPEGKVIASQSGLMLSILSPTEESAEVEEELIVTAEKRREDPQKVPISLTTLNRQFLNDAGVKSLRDVAANTPNLYTSVGDRSFNFQTIRGLGNSNYLVRDAISFYLDDVPYENIHQFLPGEFFDLERVEVLRGPQGTLYGRSSQAGVINVISRPPSNQSEIEVGGGYGNFNQRQAQFSWSDAIVKDQLKFRLSAAYNARDGFTRNVLLDEDANEQESLFGRFNLLWTPTKEWSISFNANGGRNRDGDNTFVPFDQADPFVSRSNIPGSLDVTINTQSLKVAYEGSGFNFTSITARNQTDLDYTQDTDYTPDDLLRGRAKIPSTIWSQEFRFQSPNNADKFRWLVGGYFQSRSLNLDLSTEFTPLVTDVGFFPGLSRTDAEFDQRTYAVFGQVDFKPIDALTLTAGLRYERFWDRLNLSNFFDDPALGTIPNGLALENSVTEGDVLLPRFAIQYQINPSMTLYGTIARGYKPGTQNYSASSLDTLIVRPEKLWSYEVGLKTRWLNDRLTANLALFWSNVDDYQILLTDPTGLNTFITNGGVTTKGLELELAAKPVKGLELLAGVGYTDARFVQYRNPFTGENFNGNRLTYAPELTWNLGVQYRHPVGFFGRVGLQGVGTYFFDDANRLKQNPFALVNVRVGYEWKSGGIYLYVNNLFDATYKTTAFQGFFSDLASYGDRRTFGFQVQAKF
jgi:iron complex outermembrane receptor protein